MGKVLEVNGPIVTIQQPGIRNGDQVKIGRMNLIGEVIHIRAQDALVQVYESTESLHPGERVEGLGHPLTVELGPGLLGQIFDGVQRPLDKIMQLSGEHISRGLEVSALDRERVWHYLPDPEIVVGNRLRGGQVLGTVRETETIEHRVLAPPDCNGEIIEHAPEGDYNIEEIIVRLRLDHGPVESLRMYHDWPVRQPRPYRSRASSGLPLITGQRILDTFFPMLKGGKAAVPGPFGAGKTIVQQQIARWANADIVLYVGCGERGNELVEILQTFPELTDPYSGRSLMERTFLVANTSNMPVVARCRWSRARPAFTSASRWRSTTATRVTTWSWWQIRPAAGPRRCAKLRDASGRCRWKRVIRPTWLLVWRLFTSAPAMSIRSPVRRVR
jgi:V/A-type H+-transporting ATPase subunit A